MSINCLVFTTRRADLTLEQFKDYYETKHAPLADGLFSDCKPEEYVRFYINRSEKDNATWFTGSPEEFDYDCCKPTISDTKRSPVVNAQYYEVLFHVHQDQSRPMSNMPS